MPTLRFGLLGTGYWALETHGEGLRSSSDASLEGVWGRDPIKARDAAMRLHTRSYDDLDQLLNVVDAVAIAVPPDAQVDLAVRAANAGCHLLLEKPLALDVAGAESVVQAVDKAGVASVVFFTSRFIPELESWINWATEAGPWDSANCVFYGNIFQPGNPYSDSAWRREHGVLWDVGPHMLSSVIPVMGPVSSVVARRGPEGSDTVHLVLSHEFRRGGPASAISMSLTMPLPAAADQLTFYGSAGNSVRPDVAWDPVRAFHRAVSELAATAATGRAPHRCSVHFGLETVNILAAATRALALPGVEVPQE
jgi:predicted dehydrogenase